MKKILIILLVFIGFVSNSTNYYVKVGGNDSYTGLSDAQAWATIAKVNTVSLAGTFAPLDTIFFKRGGSWDGQITVSEGGTTQNRIVISAYGTGAKPKIYGSEIISGTGWTVHSGNIYKKTLGTAITQLFADDERLTLARYPNTGYIFISATNGTSYVTASSGLDGGINYAGASIFLRTIAWALETEVVNSSSSTTLYVTSSQYGYNVGEGFFMNNKLAFLDQAGEWFYDTATNTVYVWMPDGDSPANYTMRGSITDYGIYASLKNYVTIKDLDIRQQKTNNIYLSQVNYITIDSCNLYSVARDGVYSNYNQNSNILVTNCTIEGANRGGIWLKGSNHLVQNNVITNIGKFENFNTLGNGGNMRAVGIFIEYGNGSVIRYNRLENIGYTGIRMFEQLNGLIEYNYVYNSCYLVDDGGGIYVSRYDEATQGCSGTIIRYNIIDYVPGERVGINYTIGQGSGIYLDETSLNITVTNNTVANVSYNGLFSHQGTDNTFTGNTVYNAYSGLKVQGNSSWLGVWFTNNIVYIFDRDMANFANPYLVSESYGMRGNYNNNYYISHFATDNQFQVTLLPNFNYYNFTEWKALRSQDAASTIYQTAFTTEVDTIILNPSTATKTVTRNNAVLYNYNGTSITATSFDVAPYQSKIIVASNQANMNLLTSATPDTEPEPDPDPDPDPDVILIPTRGIGINGIPSGVNGVLFGK